MPRVEVDLDTRQIESLIHQLRVEDQWRLAQRLAGEQMDRLVAKLRSRVRQLGLTQHDLARLVAEVRHGRHARSRA